MAQAASTFTKQDARKDRQAYQRLAGIVDRLLHRDIQRLDEETARKVFKSSVFATVHSLHGFLNGREVSHDKPVMKAHKFVVEHFGYRGDRENDAAVARFMARHLSGLADAERAVGHRYVTVRRADNQTQLFTSYEGTPLLDAAEWVYFTARQKPDYWKNPAAAVTDDLLDAALAKLPEVETRDDSMPCGHAPESGECDECVPKTFCGHPSGSGHCEECERWEAADLMNDSVVKGMWTKVINAAERALVKEFDTGADPELSAAKHAAKIIEMGKHIKEKLARERLRAAMMPARRHDETDEGARTEHSGKESVTSNEGGTPDKFVRVPDDYVVEPVEVSEPAAEDLPEIQRNALEYAAAGIAVLPLWGVCDGICDCPAGSECRTGGKHPHSQLARNGVYSATTDEQVIRGWFRKDPRINLGVAMGGALNLICVDIDPRNDGDASYSDLIDAHGEDAFPETFTVKTGGGGWHRYYRLPYTIKAEKGELKGKLGPGIDIKGAGGQIVAPGSIHSSGASYQVETNVYIAEAPEWMVNVLLKSASGEKSEVVVDFQAHSDRKRAGMGGSIIVEGERNERLFKVGCALWGKGEVGSRGELLQRLSEVNLERVSPPLDSDEVWKIAESIVSRYPLGVPIKEGTA
jgi:hypothetical protein